MCQDIYMLYFFNDDLPINQSFIAASDHYSCIETLLYKSFNDIIKVLCKKEGYVLKKFSIDMNNHLFILLIEDNHMNTYKLTIPFYNKKYPEENKENYWLQDEKTNQLCILTLLHIRMDDKEKSTIFSYGKITYHNNIITIEDDDSIMYYDKDYYYRDNIEYYDYPIKLGIEKRIKK